MFYPYSHPLDPDDASYTRIYTAISSWWAARARLPEGVAALLPKLVGATLALYGDLRRQLLPTPVKSHYVYNMRDLSKVFQVGKAGTAARACISRALPCEWVRISS